MAIFLSSLVHFLSPHKDPPPQQIRSITRITAQELRAALIQQELAETTRIDSERLNSYIAKRLRDGAVLASDEYEFDFSTNQVRKRESGGQDSVRICSR